MRPPAQVAAKTSETLESKVDNRVWRVWTPETIKLRRIEMHSKREAKITSPIFSLKDGYIRTIPVALIVAAIGIGAALALSFTNGGMARFYNVYLVNFCFLLTIGIGCLFFVTVTHLVRAGWSVTIRRLAEYYAACLTPMFLLFLPILLTVVSGSSDIYPWVDKGYSVHDLSELKSISLDDMDRPAIEELKQAYLSPKWFSVRAVVYFLIWSVMAWFFLRTSLKQDETGCKKLTLRMQYFAPIMMIVFAATIVFASFDFEMSKSPLWFSTMFPVYVFAGSAGAAFATIVLTAFWLQTTGRLTDEITTDHYHDLGKLMFGFVVFWGYIGFSQFMLIWYANIPEETFWYNIRINPLNGQGMGWPWFSLLLLVGHLFVPFFLIMGRTARRNKKFLAAAAGYMLLMHWVDHYWLIMPLFDPNNRLAHVEGGPFAFNPLIDLTCAVGMIAVFIAFFCMIARDRSLVPMKDPRLGDALNHVVV
jgi:hypothetical protein